MNITREIVSDPGGEQEIAVAIDDVSNKLDGFEFPPPIQPTEGITPQLDVEALFPRVGDVDAQQAPPTVDPVDLILKGLDTALGIEPEDEKSNRPLTMVPVVLYRTIVPDPRRAGRTNCSATRLP